MRHLSLIAVLAAAPCAAFAFQADFNWTGTLNPGQTLEIKGINGSIRAELATGNTIEVTARKTAQRSDPASVRVEVVPSSDSVTICSVYPSDGSEPNVCEPGSGGHMSTRDNDVEVNYTVKLPAGIRFTPKTVNGGVTAMGLRSDVNAHSVNGNIKVSTTGLAQAKSVNGSLEIALGVASWNAPLEFKTVNGSIDVTLPAGVNADLHTRSVNGDVASDFPLTVSGRIQKREMNARIGSGGNALDCVTVNGAITLHRGGAAM